VKEINFDVTNKSLYIEVDFEAGSIFKDESEGSDGKAYKHRCLHKYFMV